MYVRRAITTITASLALAWGLLGGGVLPAAHADDETTFFDHATELMGQHKYAEAELAYRQALTTDPRYKEAWEGLAVCLTVEHKSKQALAAAAEAEAAPAVRGGPAPALTDAQYAALGIPKPAPVAPAPAANPATQAAMADLAKQVAELQRQLAAAKAAGTATPAAPAVPPLPPLPVPPPVPALPPPPALPAVATPVAPAAVPGVPLTEPMVVADPLKPAAPPAPLPKLAVRDAKGKPVENVQLSKYGKAEYCDLAVGGDGTLHAIYTDAPDATHPTYLYYRSSHDAGKTWSDAQNISDDETGNAAAYARVLVDAQGRVYAIWKYTGKDTMIDGPGGNTGGVLVYRCLEGGKWSKQVHFNKPTELAFSFFVSQGPGGKVFLVWNQIPADAAANSFGYNGSPKIAALIQQVELQGATPGPVKGLVVPPAMRSKEQLVAAGVDPTYDKMQPIVTGVINLRGVIDRNGVAHFIAEQLEPQSLVHFDGTKVSTVYTYIKYASGNTFNNPPTLLIDADGVEHVLRQPEKAEKACIRDYTVGDKLTDPVEAMGVPDGPGKITAWQAWQLPNGRMAVTVALSPKGGWSPDDLELYLTFSDGKGVWTPPLCVTDNQYRQAFFSKETGGGNGVSQSKTYRPKYAAVTLGKDGHPYLLMVNSEDSITGITNAGVTGSGRVVTGMSTFSSSSPFVYFLKL